MSTPPSIVPAPSTYIPGQTPGIATPSDGGPYLAISVQEYERLKTQAALQAPPAWWQAVTGWISKKHWTAKTLILTGVSVGAVVAANPKAHAAWLDLWAHSPHWLVDVVVIATPLVALLVSPDKAPAQ